jgi:hypothetical protein
MAKKFYAQKDALGFPILGTMMSAAKVPTQANIIEINSSTALGNHPQGFKYYVRKDSKGGILANSLFVSYDSQLSSKTIDLHTSVIGPNCIEFVLNTSSGGTTFGMYVEVSSDITYTATWGDGTTSQGSINGDNNIQHEYSLENREYTVQLCFSDASAVTLLDFWGND